MKTQEIREKNDAELVSLLEELRREGFNLRIQAKLGQLQNLARPAQVRKTIAKVLTEQNKRAAAAAAK